MNTFLSSAQESLQERFQDFARNNLAPIAADLEARLLPLADFLRTLSEAGYLGLTVPKDLGGEGRQFLDLILLVEALSQFEPGCGLTIAAHQAAIEAILKFGTEAQKSRYLPLLARGEVVAGLAFAEEGAGSDLSAVRMSAVNDGERLILTGKKTWVVNAEIAGLLLTLVRITSGSKSDEGELKLALVDLAQRDRLQISPDKARLGLRSAYCNDVELSGFEIGPDNLLPGPDALGQASFALDIAKVIVAASALGLTEGALAESVEHARSRQQFGMTIGQFQAVQWKLADHWTECEGARLHTYRAAWSKDENPSEFGKFAAMSKWASARAARTFSGEAMQILASSGIAAQSPLERFYRDAKVTEIAMGTSELQKVQLVSQLDI